MEAMVEKVNVSNFQFPELAGCHILYSGYENDDYHLNVVKKDNIFYFHKVYKRNAYWRGMQEIDTSNILIYGASLMYSTHTPNMLPMNLYSYAKYCNSMLACHSHF